jgi:hypothetical protein
MTIKAKEPCMPMRSTPSSRISTTARNDCSSGFAWPCSELQLRCQPSLQGFYGLSPQCWANSSLTCTLSLLSQRDNCACLKRDPMSKPQVQS